MMMAFFSLTGCIVQIFGSLLQLAPLTILRDNQLAGAFTATQLHAAVALSFQLYPLVFYISLVLFGLFDILLGYLIYKSTFLPRFIGVWFMIGGVAALLFLWPPLALAVKPVAIGVGGIAELVLMLWLLVKGVDLPRWREIRS